PISTVGAYVIAAGQLVFLASLGGSLWTGDSADSDPTDGDSATADPTDDPWDLEGGPSHTREWR
ncbi:hypothetical protein ACFQE6_14110, partial [Natrinema soli]